MLTPAHLFVANVPPDFSSLNQLDAEHAYGSAIPVRNSIAKLGRLSTSHLSNFTAAVDLLISSGPIRFVSIYLMPSLSNFSSTVSSIFKSIASPFSILCADANAKSPLWNSVGTDHRGSELESLLIDYKLNVANQPLESLEFIPGGTSFIDLTLTGDLINLSRWLFLSTLSLSDHP
jgi:hypothetical protein